MFSYEESLEILGLDPKQRYTAVDLKKAYRKMASKYHPDKNPGDINAEEVFIKIKSAFESLTNPFYVFKKTVKSQALNIYFDLHLTFDEGFFGKKIELNLALKNKLIDDKNHSLELIVERFDINIPPNTLRYCELAFPGKGLKRGSEMGDFVVRVNVSGSPKYRVEGKNVISQVKVPLITLLKGGVIDVETMYGMKEVVVPPGTHPYSTLALDNLGVASDNKHIIVLEPVFPSLDELKTSDDWRNFKIFM